MFTTKRAPVTPEIRQTMESELARYREALDCPYCAVRPPIGCKVGAEPQCLFCWDAGILLDDSEREKRIHALTELVDGE